MADKRETQVDIVLQARNAATRVVRQVQRDVASASAGMSSQLRDLGGAWGQVGKSIDGATRYATAFAPAATPGILAVSTAAKGLTLVIESVGRVAQRVFRGIISIVQDAARRLYDLGRRALTVLIDKLREAWRWARLLALALAAAFVEGTRRAMNAFADYEQAIANAGTVTGLMGEELARARKELFDFGLAVSRTSRLEPTEIADAFYALASSGLSVGEVMAATTPVVALTEATMSDMVTTTELVTSTLKAFGLQATETERVVNTFAAAIGASRLNIERLSYALPYIGSQAAQLGIPLETTVALIGLLADRGLDASMAGTALRGVLMQLNSMTEDNVRTLERYGITLDQLSVSKHGIIEVLDRLSRANISAEDTMSIFAARAGAAAMILTNLGRGPIEDLIGRISGTNAALRMQELQLNTVKGAWDVIKSTFQEIQIRYAAGLQEAIRGVATWLQQLLDLALQAQLPQRFAAFITSMTERLTRFIVAVRDTEAVQSLLYNLGYAIGSVFGAFGRAGEGLSMESVLTTIIERLSRGVQWLVDVVFNPRVLGRIVDWLRGLYDTIRGYIGGALQWLQSNSGHFVAWGRFIVDWVSYWVGYVGEWLKYFVDLLAHYWPRISAFFGGLWQIVRDAGRGIMNALPDIVLWLSEVGSAVVQIGGYIGLFIGQTFMKAGTQISGFVSLLAHAAAAMIDLVGLMARMPGSVGAPFRAVQGLLPSSEAVKGFADQQHEQAKAMARAFLSMTGRYADVSQFAADIRAWGPQAAARVAAWQAGVAGAGQGGAMPTMPGAPEPPTPPSGAYAPFTPAAAGYRAQEAPVHININAPIYGVDGLNRAIRDALDEWERTRAYRTAIP